MSTINNRYKILEMIGKGGFGEVYKIEDLYENSKILALKKIRSKVLSKKAVKIFKEEFRFLTTLNHPNLVTVYDFGIDKDSDELFFTMEYIEGVTLYKKAKMIKEEEMNQVDNEYSEHFWDEIESYLVQSARALAYIHSKKIIHYDIKPDNFIIDKFGVLKLMDFGFAGSKKDSKVRGTIQFLAPDFVLKKEITHKIDFFSLGVSFYFSIYGKLPFRGENKKEIVKNSAIGKFEKLTDLIPQIPKYLSNIISRLMHRNSEHRYDDSTEIISEINDNKEGQNYRLFTDTGIRSYITSGKMIGRKKESKFLEERSIKLFSQRIFADNKPVFLVGGYGNGKSTILREFKFSIQLKEDISYFTADFVLGDDKIFQAFEIIIEEMIRQYDIDLNKYPEINDLINRKEKDNPSSAVTEYEGAKSKKDQIKKITEFFVDLARRNKFVLELVNFGNANSSSLLLFENLLDHIRNRHELELFIFITATIQTEDLKLYNKNFLKKIKKDVYALNIDSLTIEDTNAYIKDLLLVSNYPFEYGEFIHSFTEGVPYFIDELLIYMFNKGFLRFYHGKWYIEKKFHLKIEKNLKEITFYNFTTFTELEKIILKVVFILERPLNIKHVGIFKSITNKNEDDIIRAIYKLNDKGILRKIKYYDGFRYGVGKKLLFNAVVRDFDKASYRNWNKKIADHYYSNYGTNKNNIYALSDYYFRSGEIDRTIPILRSAINKSFENNELKLAISNLERLYSIERSNKNKENVFITIVKTLLNNNSYNEALFQIDKFELSRRKISSSNELDLNLTKYECSLKTGNTESLNNSTTWLLKNMKSTLSNQIDKAKYYLWFGKYLSTKGDNDKALKFLKKSESIYISKKMRIDTAIVDIEIGKLLSNTGFYEKGLELLHKALETSLEFSDDITTLNAYEIIGDIYFDLNYYNDSAKYIEYCNKLAEERNNLAYLISSASKIAKIKMYGLNFKNVVELLKTNINSINDLNDQSLKSKIYFDVARVYSTISNYDKFNYFIDQSIDIREKLDLRIELFDAYLFKAKVLIHTNELEFAKSIIVISENLITTQNKDKLAKLFKIQAHLFLKEKKYKKALKKLQKAIKLKSKISTIVENIKNSRFLSVIYEKLGDRKNRLFYAKQSYNTLLLNSKDIKDNRLIKIRTELYYFYVISYFGSHNEGLKGLKNIIQFLDTHTLSYLKALSKFYIGKIYFDLGEEKKAKDFLEFSKNEFNGIKTGIDEILEIQTMLDSMKLN